MFYLRRLLLVLTTVYFNKYIVVSFFVYFYCSIFLLQYYIRIRPFEDKWAHCLEILNESFVILATYFIFCFTEFILNIQIRYQIGNLFIDLIMWVIILNQIGIWYEVARAIKKHLRKRRKLIKLKNRLLRMLLQLKVIKLPRRRLLIRDLKKRINLRHQHPRRKR